TTWIEAQEIRITSKGAACAPSVEWREATEVRPLGQVRFSKDDGTCRSQPGDDWRVGGHVAIDQRQRPGRRLHRVVGCNIVLHQDRYPVQRSAYPAGTAF